MTKAKKDTALYAVFEAATVSDGRALALSTRVRATNALYAKERWAWCATLQVGDRVSTAGSDYDLSSGGMLYEQELYLDLWIPHQTAPVDVTLKFDVWTASGAARGSWIGRSALVADARIAKLELQRCEPLTGPPFDQPVGSQGVDPKMREPSLELPGVGRLIVGGATRAEYFLERVDGTRSPFPIPSRDPQQHPGFIAAVFFHAPDRVAIFRRKAEQWDGDTLTLSTLDRPEEAMQLDCSGSSGGFDPEGLRFWFLSRPRNRVAIVNVTSRIIEGEVTGGVAEWCQLAGDYLFSYGEGSYDSRTGKVYASSWTGAKGDAWDAPRWRKRVAIDPRAGKMAWADFMGYRGPCGVRTVVGWLDLSTFEGGETIVAAHPETLRFEADGTVRPR